jgi:hypothetical protein
MLCLRRGLLDRAAPWLLAACFLSLCLPGFAQSTADITQFDVERNSEELTVSAQLQFELSPTVEEALLKGIPMVFVVDADVLRERWYWYDKTVVSATRQFRLAFQPLTRRWRLNVSTGPGPASGLGLALNQSYDTLAQALSAIKRLSRWKVASASDLDAVQRYRLEFRFRLDLSQLPRPFQIGALGQSEWDVALVKSMWVPPEVSK